MPHPPRDPPGSEPNVQRLLHDLDGIVWVLDAASGAYTYVSEGIRRLLGYSPEDWLQDPGFRADRLHPDDREAAETAFARVVSQGGSFDVTYRLRTADGSWRSLHDVGHTITDRDGGVTIQGVIVAAPPRPPVDEERFRDVVEHLTAIVYLENMPTTDEVGRMLYVSPQVEELLGFTQEEWLADPVAWSRQFHPDDRDRVREIYEEVERTGGPFLAEYRMFARDGHVVRFRDEAIVVRDDAGVPRYWQGVMFDVTEQHETREQLADTQDQYRALVEQIPAIVYREAVRGDDVEVVYINSTVEAVLGITPAEWIADSGVWMQAIHPDDRARVSEENRRTEATGNPFVIEYRMIARDERVVWFRDEATLVRDELGEPAFWQGVMIDITARREAEAGLAEAEARYRALVEQLPAIAYIDPVDRHGTVYISPQTEAILGYTPDEWYANPDLWQQIVHPEDRDRPAAAGGDPNASSYRLIAKDGREVWILDQSRPVYDDAGTLVYWQGLLLDMTDQRRTLELEQALELERVEAERLRTEDEVKTTFLHAVSHDLRTPLAAILGLAVTLEREDLALEPRESRDLAHRIAQNARRLDRMVGDFLDFERLARGVAVPNYARVDVGSLLREIVATNELVSDRQLTLEIAPAVVRADAGMLERIVENLLGNTAKHTPATAHIWVRMKPWDHGLELVVEDDGPGVPEADKERIFEAFRQGSESATGSGVGLALVARFAEMHDGSAWVEDRPGGGASFHVTIAAEPTERRIDLTAIEPEDQPTETGSSADNQA
jgi:PAS domain S-box-containing protein